MQSRALTSLCVLHPTYLFEQYGTAAYLTSFFKSNVYKESHPSKWKEQSREIISNMTLVVSIEARQVDHAPSIQTPLIDVSNVLSTKDQLPCRVFFKMELEQPSGSFKLRGIGHLVQQSIASARAKGHTRLHVIASSGGNAGIAAAYSARFYDVPCTVVVPLKTMPHVVNRLHDLGANVIIHGNSINEASQHAKDLMHTFENDVHSIYCHPFDNNLIWDGHSAIVDEIMEQLTPEETKKLRGVACSVGGGGLYNGIIQGLRKHRSTASCLLVETKQAPTLSQAVREGAVVNLKSVDSIATSLACSYVPEETLRNFMHCETNTSFVRAIDDLETVKASLKFYNDFGKLIEPACGAAVSVVYNQLDYLGMCLNDLKKDDIVVVVVCGGSCANEETLQKFKRMVRECHL